MVAIGHRHWLGAKRALLNSLLPLKTRCTPTTLQVQTEPVVVDPSRVVFDIDDADKINHLVVFLLGSVPFDEGYGGSVSASGFRFRSAGKGESSKSLLICRRKPSHTINSPICRLFNSQRWCAGVLWMAVRRRPDLAIPRLHLQPQAKRHFQGLKDATNAF